MQGMNKNNLDILEKTIIECGEYATRMQSHVHRSHKKDGSILTEVDLEISRRILTKINELFPDCAVISEEETTEEKYNAPFTFVLDPIDGTDVYSLGLPSFAIALAILDKDKNPVGAMIDAPRFGIAKPSLFVRLDPNGQLIVDGSEFVPEEKSNDKEQITMGSKSHKVFDFSLFHGKIRTFGSSVIHLLLPSLIKQFKGAVIEPCFVWDIAASHAIAKKCGLDIKYINGDDFVCTNDFIWKKKPFKMPIYAGSDEYIKELSEELKPL